MNLDIPGLGITLNYEKLQQLAKERWTKDNYSNALAKCTLHDTVFDPQEEPCWRCYKECQEKL